VYTAMRLSHLPPWTPCPDRALAGQLLTWSIGHYAWGRDGNREASQLQLAVSRGPRGLVDEVVYAGGSGQRCRDRRRVPPMRGGASCSTTARTLG
jgi:hypothetical protein